MLLLVYTVTTDIRTYVLGQVDTRQYILD